MKNTLTKLLALILVAVLCLAIAGCGGQNNNTDSGTQTSDDAAEAGEAGDAEETVQKTAVRVGCLTPFEPMLQWSKEYMESQGYEFEVVLFDANNLPAVALKDGDLDGLFHNHLPWIITFNEENGSDLRMPEPHVTYGRVALYSTKHNSLDEIPDSPQIAIPGDPSNVERSLIMLQDMGFLTLGEKTDTFYTLLDVEDNSKNVQIIETEISQTARTLPDVDAAICYGQRVQQAGYDANDFLYDDPDAVDYPTSLVVRGEDVDQDWVKVFLDYTRTEEFRTQFDEYYDGTYLLFD